MDPFVVTRALLYEQVWTTPIIKLAGAYRMTDVGLAKLCRKVKIPLPPRGYWAKLQHGKTVMKRPALPPLPDGRNETISIRPSCPVLGANPLVDARAAVEQQPENRIQVSDQLHRPHPLIQAASAALTKPKATNATAKDAATTVPTICVSPAARNRALRLLDALFKALEARGYPVSASGVTIEGMLVPLGIIEKDDQIAHVPTQAELAEKRRYDWVKIPMWDYAPNGQLSIYTDAYVWWRRDLHKRWSDRRTRRLEDMLNDVVVGLVAIGVALRERADQQRHEAEERAEQERRRQEHARQARMEKARRDHLSAETKAWSEAERIRALVAAVEQRTLIEPNPDVEKLTHWIAWAIRVAAELDPLTHGLDNLLRRHQQAAEDAGKPETPYSYRFS